MATLFNTDTSIFSEAENTLKQNTQGQKPYRYFVQNFATAAGTTSSDFTTVGQRRNGHRLGPRSKPTHLNELAAPRTLPVNSAFLGSGSLSEQKVDVQSDLRWGGRIRCKKGQQLISEKRMHRNVFLPPNVDSQGYEATEMVPVDPNFLRGDGLVVPNFNAVGNNPVIESRQGAPTRNDRVVVGESWSV